MRIAGCAFWVSVRESVGPSRQSFDSGNFSAAFQRAGNAIYGRQLSDSGAIENSDPNAALWRIGVWTSLLGLGLALSLLWGQARTLGRPLEAKLIILGALGAIIVGG